jgi:hypothetical protein
LKASKNTSPVVFDRSRCSSRPKPEFDIWDPSQPLQTLAIALPNSKAQEMQLFFSFLSF